MSLFRTNIQLPSSENRINYKSKNLFLGSCFTENIGNKLLENKFSVEINPFGVLYNPVSVKNAIEILFEEKKFTEKDLYHYNDVWLSFYHDTSFSDIDSEQCLKKINARLENSYKYFDKLEYLFITWGTAWAYKFNESKQFVSNCHKIPAKEFQREKLEINSIVNDYERLFEKLNKSNPNLKVIFTLSPVRHWKDGAVQNQISKSILIVAIHELVNKFSNIEYFPSYEIVMDDLRDYRFYTEDMLHPNNVALDYIWNKFSDRYFDSSTIALKNEITKIVKARNHRPFSEKSESHQKFIRKQLKEIEKLKLENPFLNFTEEIQYFTEKLIAK
ncbi:MAG: GSCFA domain-containing protein [Bacteroidales bacterium]|jgi:hypothetical protein|nr:GSCFA domain-containing protein [Bacteroidales bacterium]